MPLYSVLRLLHGGVVHSDPKYKDMLVANKYYVVPIVNVDGVAYIERHFEETGEMSDMRKNRNPN